MTLHPEMQAVLDMSIAVTSLPWDATTDVQTARAVCNAQLPSPFEVELQSVDEVMLSGDGNAVKARLYRPKSAKSNGIVVYYHGGGWVVGSVDTYDFFCRRLAEETGVAVLSVDYRLAPEHPYPAAVDDAFSAFQWIQSNADLHGLDSAKIALAGDSAGGNIAAAAAILARDQALAICHQLLFYPVTDVDFDRPSYVKNGRDYFLTRQMMQWFWGHYLGRCSPDDAPLAAILRTPNLRDLAPATVITAEYDPLKDEGEAYARRLTEAGVPTEYLCAPGMLHGFATMAGLVRCTEPWFVFACAKLRVALTQPPTASASRDDL